MEETKIVGILKKMELKSTEELLDIWKMNDRNEWSEEAIEAIKRILITRGAKLPIQNEFDFESSMIHCPKCNQTKIRKHSKLSSVVFLFVITILLFLFDNFLLNSASQYGEGSLLWRNLVVLEIFIKAIMLITIIVTLLKFINAAGGKNKCKNCGFLWRENKTKI